MRPLLGLLILKLDSDAMFALALRTIRVLSPFRHSGEIEAYLAFIDDCAAWRKAGHETFSPGAPFQSRSIA